MKYKIFTGEFWSRFILGKSSLAEESDFVVRKRIENNASMRLGYMVLFLVSAGIVLLYQIREAWYAMILTLVLLSSLNSSVRQDKMLLEIREFHGRK